MTKRNQDRFYGYLFCIPILAGALVFLVYPIAATFYYSVTSYNPLESSKNDITVNLQDELSAQLDVHPGSAFNQKDFDERFDPVDFVTNGLLIGLNENQKAILAQEFDSQAFADDFKNGKLDRIGDGVTLLAGYMKTRGTEVFASYAPQFTGVDNYRHMFAEDQYFWLTLGNTVWYAVVVVCVQTFLALLLAVAANSRVRGVTVYKLVYFIPAITSSAAISMVFLMIYAKPGVLNQILQSLGLTPVDWLNDPGTALPAVMAMNIWSTAGYFMITFLAGLQGISRDLYECARIDGAGPLREFWSITLPMLRPQILYVISVSTIGCMQVFDQIYFLLPNMRNGTTAFYLYKNAFYYGDMGYASAIAVVLFLLIFGLTMAQRRIVKENLT